MSFPQMDEAFADLGSPIQMQVVSTTVEDYEVAERTINKVLFDAVLEPIPPQKLLIKPEGQRNWKWWNLYTTQTLQNGQALRDESGSEFRVMSVEDWGRAGYLKYEIAQAPRNPS